jgi:hypothetical protein
MQPGYVGSILLCCFMNGRQIKVELGGFERLFESTDLQMCVGEPALLVLAMAV